MIALCLLQRAVNYFFSYRKAKHFFYCRSLIIRDCTEKSEVPFGKIYDDRRVIILDLGFSTGTPSYEDNCGMILISHLLPFLSIFFYGDNCFLCCSMFNKC